MTRLEFLNTQIDNLTFEEALEVADNLIKKRGFDYAVTPNLDHIVLLEEDETFRKSYDNASLILTDGKPLIWISKIKKKPIKEKISGSDFFPKLCELASKKKYSIFILGAAEGVGIKAKVILEDLYPGINISGVYSPPLGFEKSIEEINKITDLLKHHKPDIIGISLGAPKQENFAYKLWSENELEKGLAIGIGGTIDFIAGEQKRAPKFLSEIGLEWLYRIVNNPKRLAKRYFNDFIKIWPILKKYK